MLSDQIPDHELRQNLQMKRNTNNFCTWHLSLEDFRHLTLWISAALLSAPCSRAHNSLWPHRWASRSAGLQTDPFLCQLSLFLEGQRWMKLWTRLKSAIPVDWDRACLVSAGTFDPRLWLCYSIAVSEYGEYITTGQTRLLSIPITFSHPWDVYIHAHIHLGISVHTFRVFSGAIYKSMLVYLLSIWGRTVCFSIYKFLLGFPFAVWSITVLVQKVSKVPC